MSEILKSKWAILFFCLLVVFLAVVVRSVLVERELSDALLECRNRECLSVKECDELNTALKDDETVPDEDAVQTEQINKYSFSIPVTASFYNTFGDSSVIADLAQKTGNKRLSELLSAHIARNLVFSLDIRKDLYPGDHISAVFRIVPDEEKRTREDIPDDIEILAMKYYSKKLKKTFSFYSFKPSERKFPAFFDESGFAVEKPLKNSPLKEWIQITSVLKDRRPKHDGIDFKALTGTPVYAPWSGKVLRTNWKTRYNGFSIEAEVNSNPKVYMILLHLDKVLVKPGDTFKAGDHIADVGNTGRSFAPHLHYQLQKEPGKTRAILDPIKFHGTVDLKLPETEIPSFEKVRKEFDKLMD
ncbi:MAG TPA: M23 family metallopeptidase [bacterium]|nr:M23 family metallopeptidase [bacterium]